MTVLIFQELSIIMSRVKLVPVSMSMFHTCLSKLIVNYVIVITIN